MVQALTGSNGSSGESRDDVRSGEFTDEPASLRMKLSRIDADDVARRVQSFRDNAKGVARRLAAALYSMAPLLGVCYVVALAYLCVVAVNPRVADRAPAWLAWFGVPGSVVSIPVLLAFPALYFLGRVATGRHILPGAPVLALTVMAVSSLALGLSAYWSWHGKQLPFFAPLAWTLGLFVGNVENPFVGVDANGNAVQLPLPVALEIARLLALATTLTTALAAVMTLFRAQLDRIAIWRAHSLTVVVAVDDETTSMVQAIAGRLGRRERLAVLTGNDDRHAVARVRDAGARARLVNWAEPGSLANVRVWDRVGRLYLLSEDPVQNLARFDIIDAQVKRARPGIRRLPLTVRIDDPWQAENWRRTHLAQNPRWVADAVGRYELTAAKLVSHITEVRGGDDDLAPPTTVLLCGLYPLTYALSSEFAQVQREQNVHRQPREVGLPSSVVVFARGAPSVVDDHHLRQGRMTSDGAVLAVVAHDVDPSVETISEYLKGKDPRGYAVILTDPSLEYDGTRLVSRFPDLRVYKASPTAAAVADFSIIGRLYTFPINMDLDVDAPQDVWERAAKLIHEYYIRGITDDKERTPATQHWEDLDPFYQQSNRRQVVNALWMVEDAGYSWNSLESPPAPTLPENFAIKCARCQLKDLGFTKVTVDEMIMEEHADWCRFYRADGWRHGKSRSFVRKRHEKLLTWEELHDSEFEQKSVESLAGTLISLRTLGYRSVPRSPEPVAAESAICDDCFGWRRYRRRGEVAAEKRSHAWTWTAATGDVMQASAGDWAVFDDAGHERSVAASVFESTHERVGPGRYRRSGTVAARRAMSEQVVTTLEGDIVAHLGDWIIEGPQGERWPIPDEQFRLSYEGPVADNNGPHQRVHPQKAPVGRSPPPRSTASRSTI